MLFERKVHTTKEISTSSLPDIIFLLLVFFMVVTVMKTFDAPQIDMPYATKIEKLENGKERTVLSLKSHLSPIKAAVIPLKRNNQDLVNKAIELKKQLQSIGLGRVVLDNAGNIGKSYRRHDEVGTPMCITIDFETLDDNSVTVRDRDTMEQKRIKLDEISNFFVKNL